MSYADDKRELLKLKQGIIDESDTIKEEAAPTYDLHGWKKISNLLYHYKAAIIVAIFFIALITFLVVDTLSREVKDIRVLLLGSNDSTSSILFLKEEAIGEAFEKFTVDYDNNGNVHAETYYINLSPDADYNSAYAYQTKLYGEISTGVAQIFLGDMGVFESIVSEDEKIEDYFVNLEELYPDNPNVEGIYYKVKGTLLAKEASWGASCPDDMYIAIREDFTGLSSKKEELDENHRRALEVLDNIINGIYPNK